MHVNDELIPILKTLRMSGVLDTLELRQKQAADDDLSHPEFLYRLLSDEVERRESFWKQKEFQATRSLNANF